MPVHPDKVSVRRNLVHNGLATSLQRLARVADQLVLVPFYLSAWGAATYGEWLTLTAIPTILAFSDLGFGTSAANDFVLQYASGNRKTACSTLKGGFALVTLACLTALVLALLVILCLNHFTHHLGFVRGHGGGLTALAILMFSRCLLFYSELIEGLFRAARLAARGIYISTFFLFLKIGLIATVLAHGGGFTSVATVDLGATALFIVSYYFFASRSIPGLKWWLAAWPSRSTVVLLGRKGLAYLFSPLWQGIFFQGTTLVVRAILGPSSVALFNTMRTLVRSVNQVFGIVNSTIFPELQFEIGKGTFVKARRLFALGIGLALLAAVFGVAILALVGPTLYAYWTHNSLTAPTPLWPIFLSGIILNSLWWTGAMVFRASNRPEAFAIVGTISAMVAVGTSWVLARYQGIIGAALGTLVLDLVMVLYVLRHSADLIGQELQTLPRDIIRELSCAIRTAVHFVVRRGSAERLDS